jgi:2-oxoglutarate dehydrogenase complex dehydrogenase (E1) component-like enzyme
MDIAETDRSPNPPFRPDVKRLIFCSGKMYYELELAREAAGKQGDIAICRVEQLAPFPFDLVMRELKRYPNAHVRPIYTSLPCRAAVLFHFKLHNPISSVFIMLTLAGAST